MKIYLREPEGSNIFSNDRNEAIRRQEHFKPIIERIRSECQNLKIVVTEEQSACGEMTVEGGGEQLFFFRRFLREENLLNLRFALEDKDICSGNPVDCLGAHAVIATQWDGGLDTLCHTQAEINEVIKSVKACIDCKNRLRAQRDTPEHEDIQEVFPGQRDARLDAALEE